MDMNQTLCEAADRLGEHRRFDSRQAFGKRVGKHTVFPTGLGSALAKAVREGYLTVVAEGSRRRGKTYELTPKGGDLLAHCPHGHGAIAAHGTA